MLTQVKTSGRNVLEDEILTLEINPCITSNLRITRRLPNRAAISPRFTKKTVSPEDH